jgi:hypothetical protein
MKKTVTVGSALALAVLTLGVTGVLWQPTLAQSSGDSNSVTDDEDFNDFEDVMHSPHRCGHHPPEPPPTPEEIGVHELQSSDDYKLSKEQSNAAEKVLQEEREELRAAHEKACHKIMALLSDEQRAQFQQFLPPPPPPRCDSDEEAGSTSTDDATDDLEDEVTGELLGEQWTLTR